MELGSGNVDFSNFKKVTTCDGRQYDEFSNFYLSRFWADGDYWPTAEHYFQALKFPGAAAAELREEIRCAASAMESWKMGNAAKGQLRPDWEATKLDCMHSANFLKFEQSEHLRMLLTESQGPIICDGGLFWRTWNAVILERVREELRPLGDRDAEALAVRVALMQRYSAAAASRDERAVDAITSWAGKREMPPEAAVGDVKMTGLRPGETSLFREDPVRPVVNGCPHWVSDEDWHLYCGCKNGRRAWVVDECLCTNEATGFAYYAVSGAAGGGGVPRGRKAWQVWDEAKSTHVAREFVVSA